LYLYSAKPHISSETDTQYNIIKPNEGVELAVAMEYVLNILAQVVVANP
jgi:hypothetical protein